MKNGIDKLVDELTIHCMEEIGYYYQGNLKAASNVLNDLIISLSVKKFLIDKHLTDNEKNG